LPPADPAAKPSATDAMPSAHSGFSSFEASGFSAFADTALLSAPHAGTAHTGPVFDVCHPGLALRAVLFVQAALGTGTLLTATSGLQALTLLGPVVIGGLFGTLAWLLLVCGLQRVLGRRPPAQRGPIAVALGAGCALLGWSVLLLIGIVLPETSQAIAVALAGALFAGSLWTWLELRVRSRLPAEATARLAELQARIRPHFLFNALNTAIALVRIDPERAEVVLEDLSQLIRVALENQGEAVTLDEEVDLAQRYLAIEQMRFGERLRVHWRLDPRAGAARVPPLLLQPLVENAVRHGVEPSDEGADIEVRTQVRRGQAVVSITNGVAQAPSTPGHGIALQNVRERLLLLHDVAASFEARRDDDQFSVRIEVPL
jgi:two-component system sensor histidine kinase AlgZ